MNHTIPLPFNQLPLLRGADHAVVSKPFVHQDRTLDYHVLVFVVQGGMNICEDGTEYNLTAGQLLFLKSGVHHYGLKESLPDTEWYYIHFVLPEPKEDERPYHYGAFVRRQEFLPADHAYTLELPKMLTLPPNGEFVRQLGTLAYLFNSSDQLRVPHLNLKLMELLLGLASLDLDTSGADTTEIQTKRLIHYLEEQITQAVSSEAVCAYMNLSYNYVCGLMKQKTGMTIHRYHTRLRMNEAARLLRETTLNISEISYRLGYEDPLYFSSVFKKAMGVSPREYLKRSFAGET